MKIAQVSEKFDISPDTLRYYERIGLIPGINRKAGGVRDYTEEDCGWVEFIKCMRSAGLSIEVLIEYVNLFKEGGKTATARKELLKEQRDILKKKLDILNSTVDRLDMKIERYEQIIIPRENELLKSINSSKENDK